MEGFVHVIVYVDLAAVINACVDSILLFLTAALLRQRVRPGRVLLAAAIGAVYAVATLFPGTHWLRTFVAKWLCSVVMVDLAFASRAWRSLSYRVWVQALGRVAAFYGVTFAVGGAVYGIHNLFAPASTPFAGLALVDGQVVWWTGIGSLALVTGLPVAVLVVKAAFTLVRHRQADAARTVTIEVALGTRTVTLRALIDTGNELVDPLTRIPVAVAYAASLTDVLPPALQRIVREGGDPLAALLKGTLHLEGLETRMAIVPFRGVAGQSGQLLALRPDWVRMNDGATQTIVRPLFIALQRDPLTGTGAYACILPGELVMRNGEGRESIDTGARQAVSETVHSSHSA